jgi:multidrug efflux pump subunit AcrA (membrane-fusion protein)
MSSIRAALSELRIDRKADTPKQPSWISFGIILVFLVLGFFLVEIAAFFWWRTQMWNNDVKTEIVTASVAGPRIVLNASGYIVARRVATVSSIVTGRVRDLLVEEGMKVKQGDVLARLDDSDAKAGFQLAKAQLGCASIATEQTKVQLDLAEKTLRRVTALANTKVEADEALDQAKAKVNSLKAQLDQQEAQILVAEGQVAVLEQQVQDTIIRAPFSGIVTSKDAEPGEMISPIGWGLPGGRNRGQSKSPEKGDARSVGNRNVGCISRMADSSHGSRHNSDRGPEQGDGEGPHQIQE